MLGTFCEETVHPCIAPRCVLLSLEPVGSCQTQPSILQNHLLHRDFSWKVNIIVLFLMHLLKFERLLTKWLLIILRSTPILFYLQFKKKGIKELLFSRIPTNKNKSSLSCLLAHLHTPTQWSTHMTENVSN